MTPKTRIRLDTLIRVVAPISGTSGDGVGLRVDFLDASDQQRAAAQAVIDAFDPSDAAQAAWEESQKPERKSIRDVAAQAITDIDTFLAIATPTNTQTLAMVKTLARQNKAIIKRLIQLD